MTQRKLGLLLLLLLLLPLLLLPLLTMVIGSKILAKCQEIQRIHLQRRGGRDDYTTNTGRRAGENKAYDTLHAEKFNLIVQCKMHAKKPALAWIGF